MIPYLHPVTDHLAIILLHWRDEEVTAQCLDRLRSWSTLRKKIYVVQNGRSFASKEDFAELPITWMESLSNLGFAGGNNMAIKRAMGEEANYLLLLNTDVSVEEEMIANLLEVLKADSECNAIGPVLQEGNEKHIGGRNMGQYVDTRIVQNDFNSTQSFSEVDYVPGTVCLAPRKTFQDVGLLDEDYFFSGEMADLGMRIKQHSGKNVVHLKSLAIHRKANSNEKEIANLKTYYSLRNRFLFVRKYFPENKFGMNGKWMIFACRQFFGALSRGNLSQARSIWWALRDGLQGRFGNRNHYFKLP